MMNFWMFVGAFIVANVIFTTIMTVVGLALVNMKSVQKWYVNYAMKIGEEMVELMDED